MWIYLVIILLRRTMLNVDFFFIQVPVPSLESWWQPSQSQRFFRFSSRCSLAWYSLVFSMAFAFCQSTSLCCTILLPQCTKDVAPTENRVKWFLAQRAQFIATQQGINFLWNLLQSIKRHRKIVEKLQTCYPLSSSWMTVPQKVGKINYCWW